MKTEYPELNDKAIDISKLDGGFHKTMYVNACDYNIGISCSATIGGTDYVLCFWNGNHYKKLLGRKPMAQSTYRKIFHYIVKKLQKGSFTTEDVKHAMALAGEASRGRKPHCPFNQ